MQIAVTGGQPNPGIKADGHDNNNVTISIEELSRAAGAEYVKTIDPAI